MTAVKKAPGIPDVLWKLMQELKDNPHPEPGKGQDREDLDAFAGCSRRRQREGRGPASRRRTRSARKVEHGPDAAIAAAAHDAMEHGRVTRHNRLSDRVRKIAKALAARTPDGWKALLPLLSHPDAGVREFAAYDCRDLTSESS